MAIKGIQTERTKKDNGAGDTQDNKDISFL
jgi:hypothetical protein